MAKDNKELVEKVETGKQVSVAKQVHELLQKMKPELMAALPKHLTADRLSRVCLTTIRTNPALLECSVESLLAAVMQSAQLGLEPGVLGHAYFVPYYNSKKGYKEVQFIAGFKGLMALARRSGNITTIQAGVVREGDKFEFERGYNEQLRHIPNFGKQGEITGFYAYALTKDGGRYAEFMTIDEIDKIRARSKAKESGPWVSDFEEMGKKTVIRRLTKMLDLRIEDETAIRIEEKAEFTDAKIEFDLGEEKILPSLEEPAKKEFEQTRKQFLADQVEKVKNEEIEKAKE